MAEDPLGGENFLFRFQFAGEKCEGRHNCPFTRSQRTVSILFTAGTKTKAMWFPARGRGNGGHCRRETGPSDYEGNMDHGGRSAYELEGPC